MKFKVGDKVKVKEKFWEIESDVYTNAFDGMKKLVGRTLEVSCVDANGNFSTKQDDSKDDTRWLWHKDWIELCNSTITWETLKWKDVVVSGDGRERMVLDVRNDLVDLSYLDDFENHSTISTKQRLQKLGFTIKQATPTPPEKLELTLGQVVEKFVADVTNIKIKK